MEEFILVETPDPPAGVPEKEVLRLLQRESGRAGGQVWTARFPAGTTMPRHRHTADMAGSVAQGRVVVQTSQEQLEITTGKYFFCPSSVLHEDLFLEDGGDVVQVVVASQ